MIKRQAVFSGRAGHEGGTAATFLPVVQARSCACCQRSCDVERVMDDEETYWCPTPNVRDPHRSPPILSDHVRVTTTFDDRTITSTTIARVRTFQRQSESDHCHLTTNPFGLLFSKNNIFSYPRCGGVEVGSTSIIFLSKPEKGRDPGT